MSSSTRRAGLGLSWTGGSTRREGLGGVSIDTNSNPNWLTGQTPFKLSRTALRCWACEGPFSGTPAKWPEKGPSQAQLLSASRKLAAGGGYVAAAGEADGGDEV